MTKIGFDNLLISIFINITKILALKNLILSYNLKQNLQLYFLL